MRLAVLGVGLIGGSIGLAARRLPGAEVAGFDPDPGTLERAVAAGAIDRGAGSEPGVKINNEDATWDNLQGRLTDIYKLRQEKVMFVKGDDAIPFANVANVIDLAHAAGVDKVGLITAKIEAGN